MTTGYLDRDRTALALQGGGAHGAFAWGVLDALIEAGFRFDAVCGVSSGAILAAMAVQGEVRGGASGARAAMKQLWNRVAAADVFAPLSDHLDRWMPGFGLGRDLGNTLALQGMTAAFNLFGAAPFNPFGPTPLQNPLRPILADLLDREALADPRARRLFVAATVVETGRARIFTNREITVDVLLASACLPAVFPAVTIDGVAYWDGAFAGNPPLAPLLALDPDLLVLVRAQGRNRAGVPGQPADILNRMQEIAFQAVIGAECARLPPSLDFIDVSADSALAGLAPETRVVADRALTDRLFAAGRAAARAMESI